MLTPSSLTSSSRRANPTSRFGVRAIIAALAALAGSMMYAGALARTERRDEPSRASLWSESPPREPERLGEFWDKPKPWCLDCHRRGDHRIDPSRRTAYARFTSAGEPP
jgi:hypothetical protein